MNKLDAVLHTLEQLKQLKPYWNRVIASWESGRVQAGEATLNQVAEMFQVKPKDLKGMLDAQKKRLKHRGAVARGAVSSEPGRGFTS